jgi:hypothetical protein
VLGDRLRVLADVVPFTPGDLPGYTGALFDALIADPGLQRLTQWKMLERPEATDQERDAHLSKAGALVEHYGVPVTTAMDAMMIALAAAQSWNTTAAVIRNPLDDDASKRLAEHRAAMITAVAAVTSAPLDKQGAGPGEHDSQVVRVTLLLTRPRNCQDLWIGASACSLTSSPFWPAEIADSRDMGSGRL